MKGNIFNIQRFSINDGPGIRTTVFLKGCPLSCAWCHNPESNSPLPDIFYDPVKCAGCGKCEKICKNAQHVFDSGKVDATAYDLINHSNGQAEWFIFLL